MTKRSVKTGQRYKGTMPHSEVCLHMGIAGKEMLFEVLEAGTPLVQLYDAEGRQFSFPVLLGEAGVYADGPDLYAYGVQEA